MKAIDRVTAADPEATALLVEYPMLGTALLRLLNRKETANFLTSGATATLRSRRETLFADHDCLAAITHYDVHLSHPALRSLRPSSCPFSGDFARWWKRYMPSSDRLGEVTI